ncbi:hypothetical protein CTAYLR_002092 [Chrysophaeum taylorii]|uniref:VWFA domain-containing protein n=1 Tax=Chrysophaeum taylorii TaxID=2483200 RepID=A0AAD7UPT2_9STRA|nr:hypothetical protein CTAYLR_002092 [Chrysophaeum taylorii]
MTESIPMASKVVAVEELPSNNRPRDEAIDIIRRMGLPQGIAEQILKSTESFPVRYWIVDNSGSMSTGDGHRILTGPGGREGMVTCSRWDELGSAIMWHARLAVELGAYTEFRLLNAPGSGPQIVIAGTTVGSYDPASAEELRCIDELIASTPTGRTPLCAQIRAVTAQVQAQKESLLATGKRACIIVASDGQATDGDLAQALAPLRSLPVWVVVRLCTDDDSVVEYWNSIDEELELDLDVLDDLSGEAAEVTSFSPFLTYAMALHRLREFGTLYKLVDILDERRLSKHELIDLVALIFGDDAREQLPHPSLGFKPFLRALKEVQAGAPPVWDPLRHRHRPWINIKALSRAYGTKACLVM